MALSFVPFLQNTGSLKLANKAVKNKDKVSKVSKGWKVGDDTTDATKAGNVPNWTTVKQRYWKNEALYKPNSYGSDDLLRMQKGSPPLNQYKNGKFYSMELHHINPRRYGGSNSYDSLMKVTPWDHSIIDDYRHFKP